MFFEVKHIVTIFRVYAEALLSVVCYIENLVAFQKIIF